MGGSSDKPTITPATDQLAIQKGENVSTAQANQVGSMVNQNTPWYNLQYLQTGTGPNGTPLYTATTTPTPAMADLIAALQGNQNIAAKQAGTVLGAANYGATSPGSVIGDASSGNTKTLIDQYLASVQPSQNTQLDRLRTQLSEKGLTPGNPGYDQAMRDAQQGIAQANLGAASGFENQAFSQALQTYLTPLQVASQEMGLSQPQGPSFVNTPGLNISPANYIGAQANVTGEQLQEQQIQNQKNASLMQGLFGIPSAILGGWARSPTGGTTISNMFG